MPDEKIASATMTLHIDGTVSVETDPPDAPEFAVSTELLEIMVKNINAAPIVREFVAEGERAHAIHGDTSMRSQAWDDDRRVSILAEELGEVARPLNDLTDGRITAVIAGIRARSELVQLGAMVLDWITKIDEESP